MNLHIDFKELVNIEYMHLVYRGIPLIEGEGLNKNGGNVWLGKSRGCSTMAIPLGNILIGNEASENIDRIMLIWCKKNSICQCI